jgi:phosphate starvation-inducible protein PhoH and related proteins
MTQERHVNRKGKRNKAKVVEDRWAKKKEAGRVISDKFMEDRCPPPIVAKNAKQKHYFHILNTCNVVVAEGLFGSGKSFCAAVTAADMLRKGDIDKIIVARAYVQTGKTAGFRPGTTLEKLFPYVRNILDTVKFRMGEGAYINALKDGLTGQIEVQALEDIRGRSFDEPCMLIIEEAQQCSPEEMLSIITRVSNNCTLVISGDDSQKDTKGESGLSWFIKFAKRHNLSGVGFVNFDSPDDIVRGGFVREVAFALAKDKGLTGF